MRRSELLSDKAALDGSTITDPRVHALHEKMLPHLAVMEVEHLGYDGERHIGQLVVHKAMQSTFEYIFKRLVGLQYPIEKVRPMVLYEWSDQAAMADNNTSVYRPDFIGDHANGKPSEHTRGSALDINPLDNPLINPDATVEPAEAIGRKPRLDTRLMDLRDVRLLFDKLDMEYGGHWPIQGMKDYYGPETPQDQHHFELRPALVGRLAVPQGLWTPAGV